MARLPDLELIQVNLGEEFQPFLGMKKLIPGKTPDILGQSRIFDLEGIGRGTVKLENIFKFDSVIDINGNFLSIPENKPQLIPIRTYLKSRFSLITVDIYPLLSYLKTQPNIKCLARVGKIELAANNQNVEDSTEEAAIFYFFTQLGKSESRELLVPPKLSFLKNLIFRFEPK